MLRVLILSAVLAGCGLTLAACGSSNKPKGSGNDARFLAFSQCMRAHGLTNFPDPAAGGGIQLSAGSNLNPFSPSFKAAQAQCKHLLPGGGPPAGVSAQQREQLVQTAECMRAHGVSGFPDPTNTPPTNPQNYSVVEGIGGPTGLFLLVPKTIDVNSPAFTNAAKKCNFH